MALSLSASPGASPDSIIGLSSLNGAPGTPSDDEDLPHHLPGMVHSAHSPTGSHCSQALWGGGAAAYHPQKDVAAVGGAEAMFVGGAEGLSGHERLLRSLSEGLDAIEAPKGPGERPLGAASPQLRSSFPTHTRLSAMLHIDSDEDDERSSGAQDLTPVPGSPLLLNGGGDPSEMGPLEEEEDPFPETRPDPGRLAPAPPPAPDPAGAEPRGRARPAEDTEDEDGLAEEEGLPDLDPGLDDISEPDVFSEVDETPFTEAMSHHALQGSLEEQEEGRALGEDPLSEMDSCSMATAHRPWSRPLRAVPSP